MTELTLHTIFKRPSADVLLDLGFTDRLQDLMVTNLALADTSIDLVTSPPPFSYGKFIFSNKIGYAFKLHVSTPERTLQVLESLQEPLSLFVDVQQRSRLSDKSLLLLLSAAEPYDDLDSARKALRAVAAPFNKGIDRIQVV